MKLTKEEERIKLFVDKKELLNYIFPFIDNRLTEKSIGRIIKIRNLLEKLLNQKT